MGHRELKAGGWSCITWDFLLQMADTCSNWLKYKWESVDSTKGRVKWHFDFRHDLIQLSPGPSISLPFISRHHLLQADPVFSQVLSWWFQSCKITSLESRPSGRAPASVPAVRIISIVSQWLWPIPVPVPLWTHHCSQKRQLQKIKVSSKQRVGSATLEPSTQRGGERGCHRTHGYHFSRKMKHVVLQQPWRPPWAFFFLFPKPTTTTGLSTWSLPQQTELVQRRPKSVSKETWQDHPPAPQATTSRCEECEKRGSFPKVSPAQVTTLVSPN